MTEYVHIGSHADILASGSPLAPGERIPHEALGDEDRHLVEEGRLVDVTSFESGPSNTVLSGDEAKAKAAELNIEGRSKMGVEDLRTAIAEHDTPGGA